MEEMNSEIANSIANFMKTQVKKSEDIDELAVALVKFHKMSLKIPKSCKNPFLNSRYADLSTILDVIEPALCECGLTITQMPVGEHELTTILIHESGQYIESSYKMQPLESVVDKTTKEKAITPQSIGSVITYQRRYAIGAVLNLNIDDDDDAQSHSTPSASAPEPPKKTAAERLAEAKAKLNAPSVVASEEAVLLESASSTTQPSETQLMVDSVDTLPFDNGASVHQKCSEQKVAEIKADIAKWEQITPGISKSFVANLRASGREKIADLTIAEAERLHASIVARSLEDFFGQSLVKKPA